MPVVDIVIGDEVRFSSIILNDNNQYHGIVTAKCNSEVAKFYSDIEGLNFQAQVVDSTIGDTSSHTYLLIKLLEPISNDPVTTIAMAESWIDEATLDIIASQSKIALTVFDAGTADVDNIVGILRAAGYKAAVDKIY